MLYLDSAVASVLDYHVTNMSKRNERDLTQGQSKLTFV